MRERIFKEKGSQDVWDLKNVSGGFIDIEFIAQSCALLLPEEACGMTGTDEILSSEAARELLAGKVDELKHAFELFSNVMHLQRICLWDGQKPEEFPLGFKTVLCQRMDLPSFDACEAELRMQQKRVKEIFNTFIAEGKQGN